MCPTSLQDLQPWIGTAQFGNSGTEELDGLVRQVSMPSSRRVGQSGVWHEQLLLASLVNCFGWVSEDTAGHTYQLYLDMDSNSRTPIDLNSRLQDASYFPLRVLQAGLGCPNLKLRPLLVDRRTRQTSIRLVSRVGFVMCCNAPADFCGPYRKSRFTYSLTQEHA